MTNVVPWLLTMSLVGLKNFVTPATPNQLSQDLQAPPQIYSPSIYPPVFMKINLYTITIINFSIYVQNIHNSLNSIIISSLFLIRWKLNLNFILFNNLLLRNNSPLIYNFLINQFLQFQLFTNYQSIICKILTKVH